MSKKTENLVRIRYLVEMDAFALETSTNGGETWGTATISRCVRRDGWDETDFDPEIWGDGSDGKNFVSYKIIVKLNTFVSYGYRHVL